MVEVWNHIILEGYCLFRSFSKKFEETCPVTFKKGKIKIGKRKKRKNPRYIPASKRPKWCRMLNKKRVPQFRCLCNGNEEKCPFFGFADADDGTYNVFDRVYDECLNEKKSNS